MPFTVEERKELIAIKGIGNTFVTRLEEMGLDILLGNNVNHIFRRAYFLSSSANKFSGCTVLFCKDSKSIRKYKCFQLFLFIASY